jgi:2-oxo-4-hydroxy-4-carboxy-5-ureidoimidazoline decarboxylase
LPLRPLPGIGDEPSIVDGREPPVQLGVYALVQGHDSTPIVDQRNWHPLTVATLDDFNDEPADRAVQALRACNAAPRFAAEVAAGRPYRDVETLVRRAEEAARALPWDDVAIALAAHPRIGDRVEGSSAEAESSRREQSSMSAADAATRDALVEGNRRYEERFDHVFLIRAAGRSPQEMLAELERRLGNDEDAERAEVTEQLAQITALRVRGLVS